MPATRAARPVALILVLSCTTFGFAQHTAPAHLPSASASIRADARLVAQRLVHDQRAIFEAPAEMAQKPTSLRFLAPFIVAGALMPLDGHIEPHTSATTQNRASIISDVGLIGTGATVGGLYLYGVLKHDDRAHETGLLGAESVGDSFVVYALTNVVTGRLRPYQGPEPGDFFRHHTLSSSFPSGHATFTWAMTSVLAREYPSRRSQIFWYAVGSTVAASRVLAGQHFTSDVVVGSGIGWLIGRYVFRSHHQPPQQASQ